MSLSEATGTTTAYRVHPATHVGHVHLRVANLERSLAFYRDILGLQVNQDMRGDPTPRKVAFLSANQYHHRVALAEFPGVVPPTSQQAGLFHIAFVYPSREELARAVKHVLDCGYPIDTCHEYGIGQAVNLRDPDGIPLELYYDRPESEWPRVDGQLRIFNQRIDVDVLLAYLDPEV
ncbi:MAG TPA: VOC family protein [Terriglobales bacterium]|nr:VOC family protein [Terriglobales bacterium]